MPRITISYTLNLKNEEVQKAVSEAVREGLRDTIVDIHHDVQTIHPWKNQTGHNMRSIASEVSGMGTVAQGEDAQPEHIVDNSKDEAAVYSTSGYGGILETGSWKMSAYPYFRPALDRHSGELVPNIKKHMEGK